VNLANIRDTVGGLVDDILVIVGIIGFPALFAVLYRAAVNKLEEKFASKDGTEKALIKLRSDIDGEMARLSTAAQSWLVDFRRMEDDVRTLMAAERHSTAKLNTVGQDLSALSTKFTESQVRQTQQMADLREHMRDHLDASMDRVLEAIRELKEE
jgi:hypothetical protein